ncbi:MAG TPA: ribbon-helix-helix protein, CopG family [Candidatus Moranbacteria bacterium]|nr:ribbon-helix-helix protein, CopG family [Candidatus Moranbacteria bacterium]
MRNIISISLPDNMAKMVKKEVKKGYFSSQSEFFRHVLRLWNTKQLASELKSDRKEFEKGKGKVLKSLSDLC